MKIETKIIHLSMQIYMARIVTMKTKINMVKLSKMKYYLLAQRFAIYSIHVLETQINNAKLIHAEQIIYLP